ncbi:MAG: phasin [Alphaproteobacteria bacterium]|nr:phasin [Alphaproteobacteria bacterium]MBU2271335.1 phasin [Alphaproteobacteria bacterium]MBU2419016.1 phasin [Alphaproteobacteria bacterium]
MLQAAGDVITARMEIMAAGLTDPRKIDLKEMSLMSSEKTEALSASAAALTRTFGDIGGRVGSSLMTEAGLASKAASAMATAATPAAAMQAQYSYALGWWSRATSQMLTLNSELLKGQADALRPIHATAVANAKRLKK